MNKMKTNRKAQGLPLNVIIIAVIALLVLVVIVWIFSGKSSQFAKGVKSCESKGGTCYSDKTTCESYGPYIGQAPTDVTCDEDKSNPPDSSTSDGVYCCLPLNK